MCKIPPIWAKNTPVSAETFLQCFGRNTKSLFRSCTNFDTISSLWIHVRCKTCILYKICMILCLSNIHECWKILSLLRVTVLWATFTRKPQNTLCKTLPSLRAERSWFNGVFDCLYTPKDIDDIYVWSLKVMDNGVLLWKTMLRCCWSALEAQAWGALTYTAWKVAPRL